MTVMVVALSEPFRLQQRVNEVYPDSLKTREKLDAFREPEDSDAAVSKRKSSTELGKTSANQSVTNSTSLDEGFSGCEVNGV